MQVQLPAALANPGVLDAAIDALARLVDRVRQKNSPPRVVEICENSENEAKTA